jgi:hypothetical protein
MLSGKPSNEADKPSPRLTHQRPFLGQWDDDGDSLTLTGVTAKQLAPT